MKRANPEIIREEIRYIGRFLIIGGFGARVFSHSLDTWVAVGIVVAGMVAIYLASCEEGGDDNA